MGKAYVLVEGHGEVAAAGNLVARLSQDLGVSLHWATPIRWKNLHKREGLIKGAELIRRYRDVDALLVLRDEDDGCPQDLGPAMADWLRTLGLPFPAALVLLKPEYEVLFLPCIGFMTDRAIGQGASARLGLMEGTSWHGDWERKRDVKGWLGDHYPEGRRYRATTDQLPLTRMIDLPTLRNAGVPCFGTLERAIVFLGSHLGSGGAYP